MYRDTIYSTFRPSALTPPIFYTNEGGLRFELSCGGTPLDQFLTAYAKARETCNDLLKYDMKTMQSTFE